MLSKNNYEYWLKKNWYYHSLVAKFYQFIVTPQSSVLHIGAKNETLINTLNPTHKVTVAANELDQIVTQQFDYIILPSTTHEIDDIQQLFEKLIPLCHARTRIVMDAYSFWWEPILWASQKLGLRRSTQLKNWLSRYDLINLLHIAGFELVTSGRMILLPYYIPLVSWFFNTIIANIPLINKLCLSMWLVARKKPQAVNNSSVSVIIPCRNEAGNIEPAVVRCPQMGTDTEIIFVEGHSRDNTLATIQQVIEKYPEKKIKYFVQDGKGKGDAVRKGFEHASGDIVMILDADLTVPPEELPKFVQALNSGSGEFINGCRLVYGMENGAMRFLNVLANYFFATSFSWTLSQPIKDSLCGTKVLYKKDYATIARNRSFFGDFDPFGDFDLLFGAAKLNLKIIDLPVHYKARTYGDTQIRRFYHGFILLYMNIVGLRKFKFR